MSWPWPTTMPPSTCSVECSAGIGPISQEMHLLCDTRHCSQHELAKRPQREAEDALPRTVLLDRADYAPVLQLNLPWQHPLTGWRHLHSTGPVTRGYD